MKLNIKNDGFMEYTLEDKTLDIYVEKGTHASLYVSYNGKNNVISSNIALEQDASLTLMMKNDGDEDVELIQQAEVQKDASLTVAYCELNKGNTNVKAKYYLLESGAFAQIKSACIADKKKDFTIQCIHECPYTTGLMENYAVVKDKASYRMEATGKIEKGAHDSASHQTTRVLTMSEKHNSEVLPVLLIDENEVKASHATTLGQPDENQLYYLQTRGLSRSQALGLLTLGYLLQISELFDNEEIKEKLKNEIEKKVGLHA